jgi:hypothetical protein
MFGHTLLRFDPVRSIGTSRRNPLLGWALDYMANSQGQVGAIFLIKGLVGGYRGRFSLTPYYQKIQVYGDWQDRDIWEYPLHMEPEARERILLHVWELRDVTLQYFFFTQNCSEKLLEVLEVGWPYLGRGGGFPPAVTPVDTLRAIGEYGDTLGEPILRPSPATALQDAMQEFSRRDARLVEALAVGRIGVNDSSLVRLDPELRAQVLTLSYDLLRHHYLADQISEDESRSRSRELLVARSQIPLRSQIKVGKISGNRIRPDHGHRTARVGLGGGIQDDKAFVELHFQPAYHTALDAPGGFAEGGVIKALETRVRYFPELNRVRLHEFVLLDVSTASPWRSPFRPIGWHLDLGLRTRLFASKGHGLETAGIFRAQGGVGAALAPARGLHIYGFGELVLEAAPDIRGKISIGPILRSGFSYTTPEGSYTLHMEGIAGVLTGPHSDPWFKAQINQRVSISENWSAVLNTSYERTYGVDFFEARLGLVRYFKDENAAHPPPIEKHQT